MRILLLFFFISCSHIQSGKYYKVKRSETIIEIAKKFKIKKEILKEYNTDKSFRTGSFVFIPTKNGIKYWFNNSDSTQLGLSSGQFLWPVPSTRKISSEFGRRWGRKHEGIDIPARKGTHFLSAQTGTVVYSSSKIGGYGKMVIVAHGNEVYSVYAHAHKLFVKKGQKVHRGQALGQVGATGRATGPHLHFEIRKKDDALNPIQYLTFN